MRVTSPGSEDEMVLCFLRGELTSRRFGADVQGALAAAGRTEALLTAADLTDESENQARRDILGAIRGYGANRALFDGFPDYVEWRWAELTPSELARVRYVDYSYWNELSGGSRLATDAARTIRAGVRIFDVPNDPFVDAARALLAGVRFPPLILAGPRVDALVCLEGHLRLTAHALAGFPVRQPGLVGVTPALDRWAG